MLVFHSVSEHQRYKECRLELIADLYTHPAITRLNYEREREGGAEVCRNNLHKYFQRDT